MGKLLRIKMFDYGGTWCMEKNNKGVLATKRSLRKVVEKTALPNTFDIDFPADKKWETHRVDSTNIIPYHWKRLAKAIYDHHDQYDGIFIAHGTDTMAYSASAISLALGRGLKIPIVFTGSQVPSCSPGTDAYFNFENAGKVIEAAAEKKISEVMIVFNDKVLRASRAIKISESKFQAFDSPAFSPLATITVAGVSFNQGALTKEKRLPLKLKSHFKGKILTIDVVPGLEPAMLSDFLQQGRCTGILLRSLGAGNVPTLPNYYLPGFIKKAVSKHNTPVLLSTKFIGGKTCSKYEGGEAAIEAGAIPTGDLTEVMAQVKFMWLLNYLKRGLTWKEKRIKLIEGLRKDNVGEVTPSSIPEKLLELKLDLG